MFTGIVEEVGAVERISPVANGSAVRITAQRVLENVRDGDSIAVNGVCLTVVRHDGCGFDVEAIGTTLSRTTIGELAAGDEVNLERALALGDRLGGHLVQGHVDGVGEVLAAEDQGGGAGGRRLRIGAGPEVMEMITPKGSITVSGVSLTVAACDRETFEVALIPETLARTNLSDLAPGARVNLETDILARTMIHWLKNWAK